MKAAIAVDDNIRALTKTFCTRHNISKITLTVMDGVTSSHRVCHLEFDFAPSEQHETYVANFKLQGADARIGELMREIHQDGSVCLTETCDDMDAIESAATEFFNRIEKRVGKLRQEQSVQSVKFLGNSFLLNGTTRFTVVSDDEGRLGIEIHKGDERQAAHLLASSLLDGLYDGSIALLAKSGLNHTRGGKRG